MLLKNYNNFHSLENKVIITKKKRFNLINLLEFVKKKIEFMKKKKIELVKKKKIYFNFLIAINTKNRRFIKSK